MWTEYDNKNEFECDSLVLPEYLDVAFEFLFMDPLPLIVPIDNPGYYKLGLK